MGEETLNCVEWVALIVFPDMRVGWLDAQKNYPIGGNVG